MPCAIPKGIVSTRLGWGALLLFAPVAIAATPENAPGPSILGLDHVPTAVANLDEAIGTYRKLGFALKPGRPHANGIRNAHVKFPDGSGIELITPAEGPKDALSARYVAFLEQGEGPAHAALHARRTEDLVAVPERSALPFLFFVRDNRSPTDRPEHFAHPNSAEAMTGLWLAPDEAQRDGLKSLLAAAGASRTDETIRAPRPVPAEVYTVQNGRIVLLPEELRHREGRPVVGVEIRVRDIGKAPCRPEPSGICLVPPAQAHGLWLEFHEGHTR